MTSPPPKGASEPVRFSARIAYGKERFYPEDDVARLLCEFKGQASLWRADLKTLVRLGYRVELVSSVTFVPDSDTPQDEGTSPPKKRKDP